MRVWIVLLGLLLRTPPSFGQLDEGLLGIRCSRGCCVDFLHLGVHRSHAVLEKKGAGVAAG